MTTNAEGRIASGVIDSALQAIKLASVATRKAELEIEAFATFVKFDPNAEEQASVPDLSVKEMKAVLAVARIGKFTEAAKSLGLSQPGLSRQVQRVETAYGLRFFDRRGTGTEVTPGGSLALEAFDYSLNSLARSIEAVSKLS